MSMDRSTPAIPAFVAALLLVALVFTGEVHAAAAEGGGGGWGAMIAKLANFLILVGALVYFLKSPIATYLGTRSSQIRQDLVTATEMRQAAATQLSEIEQKMRALPAELEALKARGAEDVTAERQRIAQAAAVERERLLAHTRREIDNRLRTARRELTMHAAELAMQIARQRIERNITPEDQIRLVDRYATQLRGEAR